MNTIKVIVSSGSVFQYKTGITLDYRRRRNQYGGDPVDPYPHFVLLEAHLTIGAALELEKKIHDQIVHSDGRSSIAKKKYAEAYSKFIPSRGGTSRQSEYCLYLVWK